MLFFIIINIYWILIILFLKINTFTIFLNYLPLERMRNNIQKITGTQQWQTFKKFNNLNTVFKIYY